MNSTKWRMVRHEPGSEYEEGVYTLCPHGVVIKEGLTEQDAALIEAAPDAVAILRELCDDIRAVGLRETKDDWPDLYETWRRARALVTRRRRRPDCRWSQKRRLPSLR
jgi:hypothetical protein